MADPISEERLREIASSDPLVLAICATLGEPSWADVRAIAAELLAARAEVDRLRAGLCEAMELLKAHGQPPDWMQRKPGHHSWQWHHWNRRYGALLAKHKETNQ